MTKERPILFSAPMVRAILEGRKTQTRRVVKPQPEFIDGTGAWRWDFVKGAFRGAMGTNIEMFPQTARGYCPHGNAGDQLWVRENLSVTGGGVGYAEDETGDNDFVLLPEGEQHEIEFWDKWAVKSEDIGVLPVTVPSIFCPRWASRIDLRITEARIERLQDISVKDCHAEGIPPVTKESGYWSNPIPENVNIYATVKAAFCKLWSDINGVESWRENPWIWVIEFQRVKP